MRGVFDEARAGRGIGQRRHAFGQWQTQHGGPARQGVEPETAQQVEAQRDRLCKGQRADGGAALGGVVRGLDLVLENRPRAGVDDQHVPVQGTLCCQRHVRHQLHVPFFKRPDRRNEFEQGAGVIAQAAAQLDQLLAGGGAGGHRVAGAVVVSRRLGRGKAHAAFGERLMQQFLHGFELTRAGGLIHRRFAHHRAPQRRVTDEKADVHSRLPLFDPFEIAPERGPVPGHAIAQARERHALDAGQHFHQIVAAFGGEGRDREAAVAGKHAGDAVVARRAQRRVPEYLGVVMGVDIDKPRRHHQTGGVDGFFRRLVDLADRHDTSVPDADIALVACGAGAVDDGSAFDHIVQHD